MNEAIKSLAFQLLRSSVLRPPVVRDCSQTLHQFLLAASKAPEPDAEHASALAKRLIGIQLEDGGFDIGYQFDFGSVHRTGEPTTPEMLSLAALKLYRRSSLATDHLSESLNRSIAKAEAWILRHTSLSGDRAVIPYSPMSDPELVVNNALSFAVGALGADPSPEVAALYALLVHEAVRRASEDPDNGQLVFFYYSDEKRATLPPELKDKIDFYHLAQQLEMHAVAEAQAPAEGQGALIADVEKTVVAQVDHDRLFPLMKNVPSSGRIHTWGLASIIPGLTTSFALTDNGSAIDSARAVYRLLMRFAFLGSHFAPVLLPSGRIWDRSYYVRSDAWVAHALAAIHPYLKATEQRECGGALQRLFVRAARSDYSGPENHADSPRIRAVAGLLRRVGIR